MLSTECYSELVAHAEPLDFGALEALKGSPLALDIYSWLNYRMSCLKRPSLIPWEALQTQFGADYRRLRDFKRKFLVHLADVLHVYPRVRFGLGEGGMGEVWRATDTWVDHPRGRPTTPNRRPAHPQ